MGYKKVDKKKSQKLLQHRLSDAPTRVETDFMAVQEIAHSFPELLEDIVAQEEMMRGWELYILTPEGKKARKQADQRMAFQLWKRSLGVRSW